MVSRGRIGSVIYIGNFLLKLGGIMSRLKYEQLYSRHVENVEQIEEIELIWNYLKDEMKRNIGVRSNKRKRNEKL